MRIPLSERFERAAEQWGQERVMDESDALEAKAEQALLEIEHLVSGAHGVEFDLDDDAIVYEPSDELRAFLDERSETAGIEPETVLRLYVDLFAGAFLESDNTTPEDPLDGDLIPE